MPWDRARYPSNWGEIRRRILARAGNRCEWCGAPNHALRVGDEVIAPGGAAAFYAGEDHAAGIGPRPRRIVLTIAHVHDPDPHNVDDANLAALCQRCHNRHDAPMRQANARATRARRSGQTALGDALIGTCPDGHGTVPQPD